MSQQPQQRQATYYQDPSLVQPAARKNDDDEEDPFHETVQERVDSWRNMQRQKQQASLYGAVAEGSDGISMQRQAPSAESPRDEQGRLKLLTTVSKGSRAIIFFILMFRDIHLYEVADQSLKGFFRLVVVTPLGTYAS